MKIEPKTMADAIKIVYKILNQGDSRYNDSEAEKKISLFLLNQAIFLEEKDLLNLKKPNKEDLVRYFVQREAKYIAKILLKMHGFNENEIFFERSFQGYRPDVLAEKENKTIIVECYSCKISKIIDYLSKAREVWILTYGETPWEEKPLYEKMQWFIFKKGPEWEEISTKFIQKQIEELKKIPSPLDSLMKQ